MDPFIIPLRTLIFATKQELRNILMQSLAWLHWLCKDFWSCLGLCSWLKVWVLFYTYHQVVIWAANTAFQVKLLELERHLVAISDSDSVYTIKVNIIVAGKIRRLNQTIGITVDATTWSFCNGDSTWWRHYNDVTWALGCLKSSATDVCVQQLFRLTLNWKISNIHYWPRESICGDGFHSQDQRQGKHFYVMTSSRLWYENASITDHGWISLKNSQ